MSSLTAKMREPVLVKFLEGGRDILVTRTGNGLEILGYASGREETNGDGVGGRSASRS
jgi:hypothetical protein